MPRPIEKVIPAFQISASPSCAETTPAVTPPAMIAKNVPSPKNPFPQLSRHSGRSSGSELYFAGLKIVLCTLIKKISASMKGKLWVNSATVPNTITTISSHFVQLTTRPFEYRSAIDPEAIEKSKNGSVKIARIRKIRSSRTASVTPRLAKKMTRNLKKLSLNAP